MDDKSILDACRSLAEQLELGAVEARIVGRYSNTVVALDPLPMVARVATGTALLRDTVAFARREVAVSRFLVDAGARVVAPARGALAGPHEVGGFTMSLWERVEILPGFPDAAEAGHRLRACHVELKGYPANVPYWGPFDELEKLLARERVLKNSRTADRVMIAAQAGKCRGSLERFRDRAQVLHGDAHRKNAFHTTGGPLWADWEDSFRGPVEWDLACLVTNGRLTGKDRDWSETALAGYGAYDDEVLELCILGRALYGIGWMWLLGRKDAERRQILEQSIEWCSSQARSML